MPISSVRMSTSPVAQVQERRAKRQLQVPEPDRQLYGVFGPQYAASLAKETGSTGADIINQLALKQQAAKERGDYAAEMAAARDLQVVLQRNEAYYGVLEDNSKYLQGDVELGMGGARSAPSIDPETGMVTTSVDPVQLQVANANQLNTDQQERFTGYAGAIKNLKDAGVGIPDDYYGQLLAPPTQATPVPVTQTTTPLTPSDATDRYEADEGLTAEQQMEMNAVRAASKGSGDEDYAEISQNFGATGEVPTLTYKGTPEQIANSRRKMQEQGLNPNTGKPLNPNAGANGGAAPATPAAPKTTGKVDLNHAKGIGNQFGEVTSTVRSPKHNKRVGGVKNSYHLSGRAIDVARAKGVKHSDIEKAYKSAGYKIIESLDEGDHSHFAFAGGPLNDNASLHAYAVRAKTNPMVMSAQVVDDRVLVTMKDGSQRVYNKKGDRIG